MSARQRSQVRYSYNFSLGAEDQVSPCSEENRQDMQRFVNTSLGLLTGGCEICAYAHSNNSPALFCEKRKCPVNWGNPRCELFVRGSGRSPDSV